MNYAKPKTVFDERDALRRENERLKSEIAALVNRPCLHVHTSREGTSYCRLAETNGVELSQLRAVADAAVAYQIASSAESKVTRMPSPDWRDGEAKEIWIHACDILMNAEESALLALGCAVREYRKLKEVENHGQNHA